MFKFIKKIFTKKADYLTKDSVKVFRDTSEVAARLIVLSRTRAEIVKQAAGDGNELIVEIDEQIKRLCVELGAYEYVQVPKKFATRMAKKMFEPRNR